VILTACYFHDIVSLAKNHPQRLRSSILAAEKTRRLLREEFGQFPAAKLQAVDNAISSRRFIAQSHRITSRAKRSDDQKAEQRSELGLRASTVRRGRGGGGGG
ncbi:metal-dependent phosphohydrolase, partial [Escherichia coli]|uniref:metal-dependent phosphohydrolase n=1 Tax=Escherichia coli TaxID=562 RepID=UPI0035E4571F